jgi:hypothetical protein
VKSDLHVNEPLAFEYSSLKLVTFERIISLTQWHSVARHFTESHFVNYYFTYCHSAECYSDDFESTEYQLAVHHSDERAFCSVSFSCVSF